MIEINRYIIKSIEAAIDAGNEILNIYNSDFSVEQKNDKSPLTLADKRSHEIISNYLSEFNIPILSEEGKNIPYEKRKDWDLLWIVDPLDGTKEFIKRNGEFTVNIALVKNNKPVLGVVLIPVKSIIYFASQSTGSFRLSSYKNLKSSILNEIIEKVYMLRQNNKRYYKDSFFILEMLPLTKKQDRPLTIVGSRSHSNTEIEAFVDEKKKQYEKIDYISAGSSLKFCLVAENNADIYPRLAPTMEWDTAAGQAIAENSHAAVIDFFTKKPLLYNKENLLNQWFIVERN